MAYSGQVIDPQCDKTGTFFQMRYQYILAHRSKMYWYLIWKKVPDLSHLCQSNHFFGLNLCDLDFDLLTLTFTPFYHQRTWVTMCVRWTNWRSTWGPGRTSWVTFWPMAALGKVSTRFLSQCLLWVVNSFLYACCEYSIIVSVLVVSTWLLSQCLLLLLDSCVSDCCQYSILFQCLLWVLDSCVNACC